MHLCHHLLVLPLASLLGDVQLLGLVCSSQLPASRSQRLHEITSSADEHGEDDTMAMVSIDMPALSCSCLLAEDLLSPPCCCCCCSCCDRSSLLVAIKAGPAPEASRPWCTLSPTSSRTLARSPMRSPPAFSSPSSSAASAPPARSWRSSALWKPSPASIRPVSSAASGRRWTDRSASSIGAPPQTCWAASVGNRGRRDGALQAACLRRGGGPFRRCLCGSRDRARAGQERDRCCGHGKTGSDTRR